MLAVQNALLFSAIKLLNEKVKNLMPRGNPEVLKKIVEIAKKIKKAVPDYPWKYCVSLAGEVYKGKLTLKEAIELAESGHVPEKRKTKRKSKKEEVLIL